MAGSSFLFRIDGAKDNDEFFESMRLGITHVYAGVDLRIGAPGWIPDLVKVEFEADSSRCLLTLIELEATETVALISCRKYLPESSDQILDGFIEYIDRVIRQCRSTADQRCAEFIKLKAALQSAENVQVTTAGALRSSTHFVEEMPLLDQPCGGTRSSAPNSKVVDQPREFTGTLRLSADDVSALSRCILVLDAIVRKLDHSTATFRTWRGQERSQPLKRSLNQSSGSFPKLREFIFRDTAYRGMTLDIEPVLSDLMELWIIAGVQDIDRARAVAFLESYFPVALEMGGDHRMPLVFEAARIHLSKDGLHEKDVRRPNGTT
jgi:hypothetical protein